MQYERQDLEPRFALVAMAVVLGVLAAGLLVGISIRAALPSPHRLPFAARGGGDQRAAPPLLADPAADRFRFEAASRQTAPDWGRADRSAGIATVPVDEAMAVVVRRGWRKEEGAR